MYNLTRIFYLERVWRPEPRDLDVIASDRKERYEIENIPFKDMEVMVKMAWEKVQDPKFTSASFALSSTLLYLANI